MGGQCLWQSEAGFQAQPVGFSLGGPIRKDETFFFFNYEIPGPFITGRPNSVAPGQKLGTPALWFDPCAFAVPPAGFYGNLGRGTFIGPGTVDFDMSLGKSIPLKWEATGWNFARSSLTFSTDPISRTRPIR